MAENTLQFEWIVTIQGGLDALFAGRTDVFVAGDLLWYPVEGDPTIRAAPDALVAFDRPKGHRGSYRQWEEGNVPPQVVFEVLSPSNRVGEMLRKFHFYEQYGVEEYYLLDPDNDELLGWQREGGRLREIPAMEGWTSPRLGIRFERVEDEWALIRPDGRRFATYVQLERQREEAQQEAARAQRQAEDAQEQAEQARQQAQEARQQVEEAQQRAERLAARLRELGEDPEA